MRGDLSAGRAGENPEISVTHEQLANQINSSRKVVSRTLKNMEKQNIVRLRRGKITILNQKELTRLR
ncbi:MAG: helix-turn-helix domain-containing protein [Ruminococcus sp.]|jgi:CRP/FNR family transcriptional regulator|nr:winged helix-turn-helix domain-containing protein [Ruminococcus sp.]